MAGGKSRNKTLTISPTPFKSSFLAIPPSPFSPRTPLTPRPRPIETPQSPHARPSLASKPSSASPPPKALRWLWTCHICRRIYPLGATRRCLEDGHVFCSGFTMINTWRDPNVKKRVKRHRACGSEFDYTAWKAWGRWRRGSTGRKSSNSGLSVAQKKDCWNTCDYPSECRWGTKVGIHSPIESEAVLEKAMEEVDEDVIENCAKEQNSGDKSTAFDEKEEFWRTLRAGTERRKGRNVSSPLAVVTEETEEEEVEKLDEMEISPEVAIETIDPRLLKLPVPEIQVMPTQPIEEPRNSSAVDMLRGLMERNNTSRKRMTKKKERKQERKLIVPLFTGSRSISTNREGQGKNAHSDVSFESFAPLERMVI